MGLFITFEGIEGCGKTTQAGMLKEYLSHKGFKCLLTREPGGTKLGNRIRNIVLNESKEQISDLSEFLLYLACRAQILERVIRPALSKGMFVICDRFSDSTIAYQGYGKGLPFKLVTGLDRQITGGLKPDITFLLDLNVEKGLERAWRRINLRGGGEDRFEKEGKDFHNRVRDGYLKIASKDAGRVRLISAEREPSLIHKEICDIMNAVMAK